MKSIVCLAFVAAGLFVAAAEVSAQEDATGSPLEDVTHEMKVAANHLSKKTTDTSTQHPQEEAIVKLDRLIAELEKERQSLGSGVNPNPTNPAMASNIRQGPGGMGELHGARDQGDRWGQLPPHERDRILQSLTEGFPAHYQAILEAYYKRLAVEKRAEEPELTVTEPKSGAKAEKPKPASMTPAKTTLPAKKSVQ